MSDKYSLRRIEYSELKIVDDFCKSVGFSLGLFHKQVCFKYNSDRWNFFVNQDGKILGVVIGHRINRELHLRYLVIFDNSIRGKGIMPDLIRATPIFETKPKIIFNNCNKYSLKGFCREFPGALLGPKFLIHEGELTVRKLNQANLSALPENIQVVQCDSLQMLAFVKEYDKLISSIDRSRFLDMWCGSISKGKAVTFLALEDSTKCVGYCVLAYDDLAVTTISPCYAENADIAINMMLKCWNWLFDNIRLLKTYRTSVYYPAERRQLVKLCKNFDWEIIHADFKVFHGGDIAIPYDKVFAVHEYFIT